MSSRKIIIAVATIVIVAGAFKISQQKAPSTEIAAERLFPELIDQINEARLVSIKTAKNQTELAHSGDGWVVANRDAYPANFAAIKSTLLNLSQVSVIEQKTSKAENYAKLGVAGPDNDGSESLLIDVADGDGVSFASLIVGNKRTANNLGSPNYYVRKPDQATAVLAEGELTMSDDPLQWMDTAVVSIATERVRSVTISRNGQTPIVVSKEKPSDNFFTLQHVPDGFTSTSRAVVSSFGALLLDVKFRDVFAAEKVADVDAQAVAKLQTFDGLVATLEQISYEEKIGVRIRFEFDPAIVVAGESAVDDPKAEAGDEQAESGDVRSVEDEAATLNTKVKNWIYVLADYKNRLIDKQFDDMIKPAEEEQKTSDEAAAKAD